MSQVPLPTRCSISENDLKEVRDFINQHPVLKPLVHLIDTGALDENIDEERAAFAGLYQTIRRELDTAFEDQLDNDVPNPLKHFIHTYGHLPGQEDKADPESNSASTALLRELTHSLPLSKDVIKSSLGLQSALHRLVADFSASVSPLPQAPNIPLPPSPLFHDFAKDLVSKAIEFPQVKERDGNPMKYIPSLPFENWEVGLQNLVKWAAKHKKKVRVAGYRHTWTDFYSTQDEVLVMLLPLELLVTLPSYSPTMQEIQKTSDLVGIEISPIPMGADPSSMLCTVKAGTTNDMFRNWCLENRRWCLPFNVIMVEITFGGSNGPICHGAGFSSTTLSDLVEEFHYIDPAGNPKSITDRDQLRAASGCFGLLGICTALTLRLDPMAMAVMNPVKLPLPLAIPPPPGFPVPSAVDMTGVTPALLEEARLNFIKRCEEDYYLEWFWFPRTDKVWVNTWKKQSVDQSIIDKLQAYPSAAGALAQWIEEWVAQTFINTSIFKKIPAKIQTLLLSLFALKAMPDVPEPKDTIKTLVSEALHFRRGIQNMRVRDCEWEIPLPESPNSPGKRDYAKIQWAWHVQRPYYTSFKANRDLY
ncbi:cholesterol oxidase [Ceratobasidium sp. AG-Ba]|nr:cholesterol oxidase [Ceratobasidium sp. AG-Ba]